jgi:SAM-dependent methyltransferase
MSLRSHALSQFGHPRGPLGALAGLVMARRESNRRRNAWTVEQLGIAPSDRVLELGYGPGLAVAHAVALTPRGHVVGVDRSAVMWRQAAQRNRHAVAEGRATLLVGGADDLLPAHEGGFDKAFGVNVAMFWPDPVATLRVVGRLLAPGGVVALTQQPRDAGATEEHTRRAGERLASVLHEAGFTDVEVRTLPLAPVSAVCALGTVGHALASRMTIPHKYGD